jgi:hypothetical protein
MCRVLKMFMLEWAIPSLCYRVTMRIPAVSLDNDTKPLTLFFGDRIARAARAAY